jgi:hypothetical protein
MKNLIDKLDDWLAQPAYERRRICDWLDSTARLVEATDTGDLPGVTESWTATTALLDELALVVHGLRPLLEAHIETTSCPECGDDIGADEAACATCLWLALPDTTSLVKNILEDARGGE